MKTINFVPLGNKVVIILPVVEEKTPGGLIKSPNQMANDKHEALSKNYMTIITVSAEVTKVKIGMEVMLTPEMVRPIDVDGEMFGLIDVDHLQGYKL